MRYLFILLTVVVFLPSCRDDDKPELPVDQTYFPSKAEEWKTVSPSLLGWDLDSISDLYSSLESEGARAFIVLKGGRIVIEKYWGKNILKTKDFSKDENWYWASAGKTLKAFVIGKAQEDGHLSIMDKTSDYLGQGWTSLTTSQEDMITIRHQLTMTSGLDDNASLTGFDPEDLLYKGVPGSRWAYHNGPYALLEKVIENALGGKFKPYYNATLRDKIGMDGFWQWLGDTHLYMSTGRSAARYGHLMLNNGVWNGTRLLNSQYVNEMISPSQGLNKSYGYLWWLNGPDGFRLPQSQVLFSGKMVPSAPEDMFSAIGKNGQFICVVPSLDLVLIRMGENPDSSLVPVQYLEDIWHRMNGVMMD